MNKSCVEIGFLEATKWKAPSKPQLKFHADTYTSRSLILQWTILVIIMVLLCCSRGNGFRMIYYMWDLNIHTR